MACTVAVAFEFALAEPKLFDAVTVTRSRLPTSAVTIVYRRAFAPPIAPQFAALESHRSHWYLNDVGDLMRYGVVPGIDAGMIDGSEPFCVYNRRYASGVVHFPAFTTTRRRWPTSAALTRYDELDAPEMVAQLLPAESQRSQLYA